MDNLILLGATVPSYPHKKSSGKLKSKSLGVNCISQGWRGCCKHLQVLKLSDSWRRVWVKMKLAIQTHCQQSFSTHQKLFACIQIHVWQELKPRSKTCRCEPEDSRVHFVPQGDDLLELMDLKQMDDRLRNEKNGTDNLLPALTSLEAKWT